MKKVLFILSFVIVGLSACKKDKTISASEQAAIDDAAIQTYLAANPSINATKDPSGVYYQVLTEGNGTNPTLSSTVTVNYVGKLLDGTQFESGNITYALTSLIKGWQFGVPHVKSGGRILLIIPSGLAYGPNGSGKIPGNANLIFTIDLLSFK
ncbi:hypothetical protein DYU05_19050 [Mucilaginibacter terrenus]|uniref:Peptidyl-prolyl cis-trans isomerase n=1 Tax=Mucilaginibacter terrenus TaxID=2482727 RepID=A0A3E2NK55_9SPHI|nr:FKBP-type peptidyl-prolyl cis-trans isomerase [Mucilaginibacter terrenus]RFZ81382.1 hypothetical protein DYU05_19050 [Mucilaginibacter terrenus]